MAEARSQQAASLTEFYWLGHKFPISNAKTRVAILKGTVTASNYYSGKHCFRVLYLLFHMQLTCLACIIFFPITSFDYQKTVLGIIEGTKEMATPVHNDIIYETKKHE